MFYYGPYQIIENFTIVHKIGPDLCIASLNTCLLQTKDFRIASDFVSVFWARKN